MHLHVRGVRPVFDLPKRKSIQPIVATFSVFRSEYHFFTHIVNFECVIIARSNCYDIVIPRLANRFAHARTHARTHQDKKKLLYGYH
jgi:hypothetical protein